MTVCTLSIASFTTLNAPDPRSFEREYRSLKVFFTCTATDAESPPPATDKNENENENEKKVRHKVKNKKRK